MAGFLSPQVTVLSDERLRLSAELAAEQAARTALARAEVPTVPPVVDRDCGKSCIWSPPMGS